MTKRTRNKTKGDGINLEDPSGAVPALILGEEALAASYSRRDVLDPIFNPLPNLANTPTPFSVHGNYIDCKEAIQLALKAYWAFPLLRNVVEVMGELANSRLYLKGGNKKTRDLIEAWMEKVNIWQLKEQFFREWFRSANCFIYEFEGEFRKEDLDKMTQVYGSRSTKKTIPIKYIILNPETIVAGGNISFDRPIYYKALSIYELQQLRNPKTPEDKAFLNSLDEETRKAITDGREVKLTLSPENLTVLLYKAQGYEPMGVPMCYGVLKDIEAKLELKRIDLSIARTTDRALLLMTVGESPSQFVAPGTNINLNTMTALQTAFRTESIARTIVTDYTVKGEWLIPEINKVLGAEKYEQIDKDINIGLNAVLFNEGEKFANASVKVQIFIERLKEARNAFLNNFLQKQIIKVCKAVGAKNYPEVVFEDLTFKDEISFLKLVVQLAQLGFLTPDEMFNAMDTGKLPIYDESVQSQRDFKMLREEGLYMPIIGSSTELQKQQVGIQKQQVDNQKEQIGNTYDLGKQQIQVSKIKAAAPVAKPAGAIGRPKGSTGPKATPKPKPIGSKASIDEPEQKRVTGFSLKKLQELFPIVSNLHNKVEAKLCEKFAIATLNETQSKVGTMIVESIISNEHQDSWEDKISEYLAEPKEIATAAIAEIENLQIKHNIDQYLAAMLRLVERPAPEETEDGS